MRNREAERRGHGVTSHLVLQVTKGAVLLKNTEALGKGYDIQGCWTTGFNVAAAGMLLMGPEDHRRAVLFPMQVPLPLAT